MRTSGTTLAAIAFALVGLCATVISAEPPGRLHGSVVDESGGLLPGVTVVAVSDDGRILATVVTDQVGRYAMDSLPEGAVRLTFQLEGFSDAADEATVGSGRDTAVAPRRLLLAARSESVTVQGKTPVVVAVVPPYRPPLPNPPPPVVVPVPAHDRDSICGPAKPDAATESLGTIRSRRRLAGTELYVRDDELRHRRRHGRPSGRRSECRGAAHLPRARRSEGRSRRAYRRPPPNRLRDRAHGGRCRDLCVRRADAGRLAGAVLTGTDARRGAGRHAGLRRRRAHSLRRQRTDRRRAGTADGHRPRAQSQRPARTALDALPSRSRRERAGSRSSATRSWSPSASSRRRSASSARPTSSNSATGPRRSGTCPRRIGNLQGYDAASSSSRSCFLCSSA